MERTRPRCIRSRAWVLGSGSDSMAYIRSIRGSSGRRPERPSRCSSDETENGAPTCATQTMSPISMPSSSVDVQMAVVVPRVFRRFSRSRRCSRDKLAWWGKNSNGTRAFSDMSRRASEYHSTFCRDPAKIRLGVPRRFEKRCSATARFADTCSPSLSSTLFK